MADLSTRLRMLERRRRTSSSSSSSSTSTTPCGGRPLTGEELALRLGVTGETIRRWAGQGMLSCGTHPSRTSWPVYDEAACRAWAAANQPQTALRPTTGSMGGVSPAGGGGGEGGRAALRARRLHLQCQLMRLRLIREREQLLEAGECRAAWRRHSGLARGRLGALPAQTAARLAGAFGLGEEARERFTAILAAEMARVTGMVSEDPLADAEAAPETRHGR